MSHNSPIHAQYVNRSWQCQQRAFIDALSLPADAAHHVCQLQQDHLEPHQCWCGCLFTSAGTTFRQMRLPDAPA